MQGLSGEGIRSLWLPERIRWHYEVGGGTQTQYAGLRFGVTVTEVGDIGKIWRAASSDFRSKRRSHTVSHTVSLQ